MHFPIRHNQIQINSVNFHTISHWLRFGPTMPHSVQSNKKCNLFSLPSGWGNYEYFLSDTTDFLSMQQTFIHFLIDYVLPNTFQNFPPKWKQCFTNNSPYFLNSCSSPILLILSQKNLVKDNKYQKSLEIGLIKIQAITNPYIVSQWSSKAPLKSTASRQLVPNSAAARSHQFNQSHSSLARFLPCIIT